MARPRGADWLEDEMSALRTAGVDVLVCALTHSELDELGLVLEAGAAADAGLRFVAVPVPDRTVPDLATVLPTLRNLAESLREGAHVVTHCRFGTGRASLLAAALLVLNGVATPRGTASSRPEDSLSPPPPNSGTGRSSSASTHGLDARTRQTVWPRYRR
jgi:protein tyrosine phosphatase (PTP) superfamily phosphohydrolase (DUF442 family)